ncbi:MAG: glycosyltransferase [Chthoniobacterales bacterium]
MSDVAEDYAFRLDARIAPRLFGEKLDISGWIFHRRGEPIQGVRALVQRPLAKPQIVRGRRKRNRPDVAAAFPDQPEAMKSGFLLELRLSLGRNRLQLQVLDDMRVWRTFGTVTVTAFPLRGLSRAGFPRVRELVASSLTRSFATKRRSTPRGNDAAPPAASSERAVREIELFATSRSNLFILEIAELLAAGFRELGCAAQLHLDQPPEENPPHDILQLIVTPHELYNLYLTSEVSRERARELTRHTVLLCTEQPETGWFLSNLEWAPSARAVADINPLGVLAYRAREVTCHHLALGYHPLLAHALRPTHGARATEITFLGSLTPRREEFFARHADFFSRRRCHLRFVPLHFAKTAATRSYLSAARRNELLSDTRILLNVHYSEQRYFEWHRMLVGLANGCCIITETCDGYGRLVPGEHFIMVEPENLIPACEYYLSQPNECARIAEQGFAFVEKHLRQAQLCENFLRELATAGCDVPRDAAPVPLPSALRRNFSRLRRRDFRRAAVADLREVIHRPDPPEAPTPPPSADMLAAQRARAIENRAAYRARLDEQEELRTAGKSVWTLHHNAASLRDETPALSVVITLFNYAQFIGDCVKSIEKAANQLREPIEIVIVDDNSTDDSLSRAILSQNHSSLPVRIVAKRFNTGLADARNLGTQLARGSLVFMMDADNLVFPAALRELFAAITAEESDAAYSLLCRFNGSPANRVGLLSPYAWDPQILVQHPYVDAMALFRRDVLLDLGGYDNQLSQVGWFGWEDYDTWLRFAVRGVRVAFVPNILCLYRQHETSMINSTNLFEAELADHFIERYGELLRRFPPAATVFGIARPDSGFA